MIGRRGCSCFALAALFVCVIGAVLLYAVGLPRFREEVRGPVEQALATEIARQIAIAPDAAPAPGTYVLEEAELNEALRAQAGGSLELDDIQTTITPNGITIEIEIENQTATYTGDVGVAGGRLVITDMTAEGRFRFFLPGDDMADILEDGVNTYLDERNLRLSAVELGDGTLTLTTVPAA